MFEHEKVHINDGLYITFCHSQQPYYKKEKRKDTDE
jgi:hypothetical protein